MTRNVRSKVPLSHRSIAVRTADTVLYPTTRRIPSRGEFDNADNGVQGVV
jgi:hypothetical protein